MCPRLLKGNNENKVDFWASVLQFFFNAEVFVLFIGTESGALERGWILSPKTERGTRLGLRLP